MSYASQDDLKGLIPPDFMTQALDDNGDGQEDAGVFDAIALGVQEDIDGPLGSVYRVPFAVPLPSIIHSIAKVLTCEALFKRRQVPDNLNPWVKPASDARATIKRLVVGDEFLPGLTKTSPAPALISEPAKTTSTSGRLMN